MTSGRVGAPSVIVSGMIAATPHQGGASWAVLQYLLGLERLGCDVHFVEPVGPSSGGAAYCAAVMERFGFGDRWALIADDGETVGFDRARLKAIAAGTDLLLNVSGMLTDPDVLEHVPVRAYVDLDPAFIQLWHAVEGIDMRLDAHTHFVTIADTVGQPGGRIPDCGRTWLPILPPVVLEEWPVAGDVERRALTTVGHWRGYGSITSGGIHYGQRAHSLRPLMALPRRVPVDVSVALAIHPDETADRVALDANGWQVVDPAQVAAEPDAYRRFVQGSWAEIGVAKSGYVVADSGWFSDRSACYLASGRPVIAQATGFDRRLPTGHGLLSFSTVDDVVAAVETLEAGYDGHRAAARGVAEEFLDSDRVLTELLDRLLE